MTIFIDVYIIYTEDQALWETEIHCAVNETRFGSYVLCLHQPTHDASECVSLLTPAFKLD